MARLKNFKLKGQLEAGCDEAGRGCLAGPVYAAAVILKPGLRHALLDDSKKLSEHQRKEMREFIEEKALAWSVASVSAEEIDQINILQASFLAMHRAIDQLSIKPEFLLIDGNRFRPYTNIPHSCEIKGDGRFKSIAAASILAKTHRDEKMAALALDYPQYDWDKNKGYPTKKHRLAIQKHGASPWHRMSFTLLPPQLKLKLE